MPITVDATSKSARVNANDQITFTHVVGAGANLFVLTSAIHTGGAGRDITDANIGGTALTEAKGGECEIWYCVNPPVGSKTVTVNYGTNFDDGACGGVSFFGADTVNPLASTATGNTTGTPSTTVTAVSGGVVVDALDIDSDSSLSPGTNQVEIHDVDLVDTSERSASSYKLTAVGGSTTMTWNLSATHVVIAAVFNPRPNGGAFLFNLI